MWTGCFVRGEDDWQEDPYNFRKNVREPGHPAHAISKHVLAAVAAADVAALRATSGLRGFRSFFRDFVKAAGWEEDWARVLQGHSVEAKRGNRLLLSRIRQAWRLANKSLTEAENKAREEADMEVNEDAEKGPKLVAESTANIGRRRRKTHVMTPTKDATSPTHTLDIATNSKMAR